MDYIPEEKITERETVAEKQKFFSADNSLLKNIVFLLVSILTIYLATKTTESILGVSPWGRPEFLLIVLAGVGITAIRWIQQRKSDMSVFIIMLTACVAAMIISLLVNTIAGKEVNVKTISQTLRESNEVVWQEFNIPNDGAFHPTIPVPDKTTVKLESDEEFFIVEGSGETKPSAKLNLVYAPMAAGKSFRYCEWGGTLWLKAKERPAKVKVRY